MSARVERRLRLAYLTSIYPRATDTFVRNEVVRLRERGHEVHTFAIRRAEGEQIVSDAIREEAARTFYLLTGQGAALAAATLRRLFTRPGSFFRALGLALRTHPPGLRGWLWQLAYFAEACLLADRLEAEEIGHLHDHIAGNSATVAMLASELSGVPWSFTVHGPTIFTAPAHWALAEKIRHAAFTVCITDFTRSQCMLQVEHAFWDRLHVVRCSPDAEFLATEPPPPKADPRLVFVGRLSEQKATPLLIEAAAQVAERHPELELVLIGDGPLRGELEQAIRRHGLEARVQLRGWLPSEQVRDEILNARAIVMPSFGEGLPIVVMEALAQARPVIGTYIAGLPELIEHRKNGWLVPAGSVDAMAAAMSEALATPADRLREMGLAGRRAVLERHDPEEQIARLEELFATHGR